MPALVNHKSFREKVEFIEEKVSAEQQQYTTLEKPGPVSELSKKQRSELTIQQCDTPKGICYSLREESGNIGRHSSNQIIILDESISRHHARIEFFNGEFFIKDIGSTTGTFIRINNRLELK
jgi:pSer/pThr/pTyr-binding forkhead associated (FHA) protein